MRTLRDRVAVVTGAASGIGRATAVALARRGCHLALVDVNESGLAEVREDVERVGRRATTHVADVAQRDAVRELVDDVERAHSAVHVLINNAGVSVAASFEQHSLEDFEWLMGINFWGVIYGCKFFLPLLRRAPEGHIVNISSVFGLVGVPLNSSYCASKFAVRGFSESLRAELAGSSIGVTSVHPGGVKTNIVKASRFVEPGDMQGLQKRIARAFEKMLPPEKAAESIVQGVRRNSPRVLITREAHLIDAAKRAFPAWASELVGWRWRDVIGRY